MASVAYLETYRKHQSEIYDSSSDEIDEKQIMSDVPGESDLLIAALKKLGPWTWNQWPVFQSYSGLANSSPEREQTEMDPGEEKYIEQRLDSIEMTMETAIKHQTEEMELKMNGLSQEITHQTKLLETIAGNLEKSVDRALIQSDITRKESADNSRWHNRLLVSGILGVLALFVGMIYFMVNLNNNFSKDNTELRNQFSQSQRNLTSVVSNLGTEFYKTQEELTKRVSRDNEELRAEFGQFQQIIADHIDKMQKQKQQN